MDSPDIAVVAHYSARWGCPRRGFRLADWTWPFRSYCGLAWRWDFRLHVFRGITSRTSGWAAPNVQERPRVPLALVRSDSVVERNPTPDNLCDSGTMKTTFSLAILRRHVH